MTFRPSNERGRSRTDYHAGRILIQHRKARLSQARRSPTVWSTKRGSVTIRFWSRGDLFTRWWIDWFSPPDPFYRYFRSGGIDLLISLDSFREIESNVTPARAERRSGTSYLAGAGVPVLNVKSAGW